MGGPAILAPVLSLGAAFCFALALILTQYGLRTVPSWRSPLYTSAARLLLAWLAALVSSNGAASTGGPPRSLPASG